MSLYPSLEDMKIDMMSQAQESAAASVQAAIYPPQMQDPSGSVYPGLADFMGLELSSEVIALNMPEYLQIVSTETPTHQIANSNVVAPLSGDSLAMKKAFVTQGIRQVQLCKDSSGKVGLHLKAINNGIFVCLVMKDSPAAMAGLRFGDQILEINNVSMAGLSMDGAHKIIKKAPTNGIMMAVRDRPFERTITLHKDSAGCVGFQFKEGKIVALVKDSSATRNGLLIDHQMVEINGQNVVGLKDKEIVKIISACDDVVTFTILPYSIYKHMVKKISINLITSAMDHSPIA